MIVTRGHGRRHDRRRPPRIQGDRDRARSHRRARAARAASLSAGREPRAMLRRSRAAAVRADWTAMRNGSMPLRRCAEQLDCVARRPGPRRSASRRSSDRDGGFAGRHAWLAAPRSTKPRRSPASLLDGQRRAGTRDARRRVRVSRSSSTSSARPISPSCCSARDTSGARSCARSPTIDCRIRWVDTRDDAFPASIPDNVECMTTDTPEAEVAAAPARCVLSGDDAQPSAGRGACRVHSRSRRLRLFRLDRLGVEAASVRKAAGSARRVRRRASRP